MDTDVIWITATPDGAEPVEHSGGRTQREKSLRHNSEMLKCEDCARLKRIPKGSKLLATKSSGTRWKEQSRYERQAKPRRWLCNIWGGFQVGGKNRARIPRPRTRIGASEPGAWFTLKRGFLLWIWELSRFLMLNKNISWRVFQKIQTFF